MLSARDFIFLMIIFFASITRACAQVENITSRFYFPGSIGLSTSFGNAHTQINDGLSINTAIEYRPTYINDVFFRIDYDALNNNYSSFAPAIPTNIIKGKLSTDFLIAGVGYRGNFGRWGLYGIIQPGLGIHSFEKALNTPNGVLIYTVTRNNPAVKIDIGVEYYITKHFAAVFDPSYYKLFSNNGFNTTHSKLAAFNIGITTTIL